MLGDYCRSLKRDEKNASHKRYCNLRSFDKKKKDFTNHCKSNLIGRGVIYLAFTDRGGTRFVLQENRRSHPSPILMGFGYVVEYKKIFTHL